MTDTTIVVGWDRVGNELVSWPNPKFGQPVGILRALRETLGATPIQSDVCVTLPPEVAEDVSRAWAHRHGYALVSASPNEEARARAWAASHNFALVPRSPGYRGE